MSKTLDVAKQAIQKAGEYLLSNRGQIQPENIDQKSRNDFVTHVDHQSEQIIVDTILNHFPDHEILAEEGTEAGREAAHRWIIDPLDGTKNFIQDLPVFTISIALESSKTIQIGVVYDVVHREMFWAERGTGAFMNDRKIKVSRRKYAEALIATGFPHKSKNYLPKYLLSFEQIFLGCSGMRRLGSAALDLCYTAMGRFEGFWELGLSIWDIAAGSLILEEAGGIVTDFWGDTDYLNNGFILAGNRDVHQNLLDVVSQNFHRKN